jgi:hypothetical protein
MRGLDIKNWGLWDWIGAACLVVAALILALDAALEDAPTLAAMMPAFFSGRIWAYMPLALVLIAATILIFRARQKNVTAGGDDVRAGVSPRIVGPFQVSFEPPSKFRLLPLDFTINFTSQIPYVEVRFYAIHFLPRMLVLTHLKLSLRVDTIPLELIPLVQDDLRLEPASTPIVVCRRNLTDSELRIMQKKAGRENASFELFAKAMDGAKALAYGPVSSKVIEGWIYAPAPPARA